VGVGSTFVGYFYFLLNVGHKRKAANPEAVENVAPPTAVSRDVPSRHGRGRGRCHKRGFKCMLLIVHSCFWLTLLFPMAEFYVYDVSTLD